MELCSSMREALDGVMSFQVGGPGIRFTHPGTHFFFFLFLILLLRYYHAEGLQVLGIFAEGVAGYVTEVFQPIIQLPKGSFSLLG